MEASPYPLSSRDRSGQWACGPPQGDENGFCPAPFSMEASPSPLSSRPGFPVTQHRTRQRVRLSVRKGAWSSRNPPTSTGNPGRAPRIFYYAAPEMATCAAFIEESRMKFADHTNLRQEIREAEGSAVPRTFLGNVFRRSVAQWRDLRFLFSTPPRAYWGTGASI